MLWKKTVEKALEETIEKNVKEYELPAHQKEDHHEEPLNLYKKLKM